MSKKVELGKKLIELALKLVDQASAEGVDLETRLDVVKTVGNFHLGETKISAKKKEADSDDKTFDKYKNAIDNLKPGDEGHA